MSTPPRAYAPPSGSVRTGIDASRNAIEAARAGTGASGAWQVGGIDSAPRYGNSGVGAGGGMVGAAANATISSIIAAGPPTGGLDLGARVEREAALERELNDNLAAAMLLSIMGTQPNASGKKSDGGKSGNAGATTPTTRTANVGPGPTSSTTQTSPAPTPSPSAGNPVDTNAGAKQAALNEYNAAQQENRDIQDELKRTNEQQSRLDAGQPTEQDEKEAREKFPGKTTQEALNELKYAIGDKIVNEINPKVGQNGDRIKTAEKNVKSAESGRSFNH